MALASPNVRVAHHVACVSCSDHFYAQSRWAGENVLATSSSGKPAVRLEPRSQGWQIDYAAKHATPETIARQDAIRRTVSFSFKKNRPIIAASMTLVSRKAYL
jgi:hypothetical protein